MSFIQWLILGLVAYASGFGLKHYYYKDKPVTLNRQLTWCGGFFIIALVVFAMLNFWALKKPTLDVAFIGVSSVVATFIFYYGLVTDTTNTMKLPD